MDNVKKIVQEKYAHIVLDNENCCGTSSCCSDSSYTIFSESYSHLKGYKKDADYSLGCGLPTEHAGIGKGDALLDLGSGAGNDCFVARALVGEKGKVTGLDFTMAMLEKARENNKKLGYKNVEFVQGDIEAMPFKDGLFDVIISNCVLNLVPDKEKAFTEMFRVLKTGGHFCVSDVVIMGQLPEKIRNDANMYAGCVAGAIDKTAYLSKVKKAGFKNLDIKKEKQIELPDELLLKYLNASELEQFKNSGAGIYSITLKDEKQ